MIPENLIFISAQPHDIYFAWQIEVQACNFRKHGISDRMHVIVWFPDNQKRKAEGGKIEEINTKIWAEIAKKYPEIKFAFIKDEGVDLKLYIPQIRPHILGRYFDQHPELSEKIIFYHDSDIIFNFLPDFETLCVDTINWQSDTSGYLDYNYLHKKEEQGKIPEDEAVDILAKIGNVTVDTFKSYTGKTGGAQYIFKGIDGEFWKDIERQVLEIRKAFWFGSPNSINSKYFSSESAGFQSWCADMWAVNMALWSRNKVTDVTPQLDFSWATDGAETYKRKPIFHNAGVVGSATGLFYKGKWMTKSPIGHKHIVPENTASYYYVKAIEEASKIT